MEISSARFTKRDGITFQEDFFCTRFICRADYSQGDVGLQERFEMLGNSDKNQSVHQKVETDFEAIRTETAGEEDNDVSVNRTVEIEFGVISARAEAVEDNNNSGTANRRVDLEFGVINAETEEAIQSMENDCDEEALREGCAIKVSGLCQISFERIIHPLELEPEDFIDLNNEKQSFEILRKTEDIDATTVFDSELNLRMPVEDDEDTSLYATTTMGEMSALEDSEINRKVDCAIADDAAMPVLSQKENLEREKYDGDSAIVCSRDNEALDKNFKAHDTHENNSQNTLPVRLACGIDVAVGHSQPQPIDLLVDSCVGTSQPMYEDSCTNTSQEYVLKSSINIYSADDNPVSTPEKSRHHSGSLDYEIPQKRRKILGEICMDRFVPDSQMKSSKSTGGRDFKGKRQNKSDHEENTENNDPLPECERSSYPQISNRTQPFLRIGLSRNARIPPLLSSVNRNNLKKP